MKLNKFLSIIAGTALLSGAWACTDEVEYNPTPTYNGDEVYFSIDEPGQVAIPEGASQVTVKLYRVKAEDEITVGLQGKAVDASGNPADVVFNIPTQINFPKDVKEVEIPIGITFSSVTPDEQYCISISVAGEFTTPYGLSTKDFYLTYAPWSAYKRYGGKDEYATITVGPFGIKDKEVAVYVSQSLVSPNERYQFGDAYDDELNSDENSWTSALNGYNWVVTRSTEPINEANPNIFTCTVTPVETGDDTSLGSMLYLTDVYTYCTTINPAFAGDIPLETIKGMSYYNSETGIFSIHMIYYTADAARGQQREEFQLPGFVSYSVDFSYTGNYVDAKGNEFAIVDAYKTDGVNSYVYSLKAGALTDEEATAALEELAADDSQEPIYDTQTNLSFPMTEDGAYTIVAIGFDESSKQVCTSVYTFNYETVQADKPWRELGVAEYTDGFLALAFKPEFCNLTWEVSVWESKETPGVYRVMNPYVEWPANVQNDYAVVETGGYMDLDCRDPKCVFLLESPFGIQVQYAQGQFGELFGYSFAEYLRSNRGYTNQQVIAEGANGTMVDGVVTFPAGQLLAGFMGDPSNTLYYANIDPKNETDDVYWGKGPFMLDMSLALEGQSARMPRKVVASKAVGAMTTTKAVRNASAHKANISKKVAKRQNTISAKELMNYYKNNVQTKLIAR